MLTIRGNVLCSGGTVSGCSIESLPPTHILSNAPTNSPSSPPTIFPTEKPSSQPSQLSDVAIPDIKAARRPPTFDAPTKTSDAALSRCLASIVFAMTLATIFLATAT